MPKNLKIGHYRIEEVNAPEGYTINKNYVEIAVDANTAYQIDVYKRQKVMAGLTGTVTTSAYNDSYGNYVIIKDRKGYELRYAHLSLSLIHIYDMEKRSRREA